MKLIINWTKAARPIADDDTFEYQDEFVKEFHQLEAAGYEAMVIPICQELVFAAIRAAIAQERIPFTEGHIVFNGKEYQLEKSGQLKDWPHDPNYHSLDAMAHFLMQIIK